MKTSCCRNTEVTPDVLTAPEVQLLYSTGAWLKTLKTYNYDKQGSLYNIQPHLTLYNALFTVIYHSQLKHFTCPIGSYLLITLLGKHTIDTINTTIQENVNTKVGRHNIYII